MLKADDGIDTAAAEDDDVTEQLERRALGIGIKIALDGPRIHAAMSGDLRICMSAGLDQRAYSVDHVFSVNKQKHILLQKNYMTNLSANLDREKTTVGVDGGRKPE